jgi:hypothetical protein
MKTFILILALTGINLACCLGQDFSDTTIYVRVFEAEKQARLFQLPNLFSETLKRIRNGDSVRVLSYNGDDFFKVRYKDEEGYVSTKVLQLDKNALTIVNNYNASQRNSRPAYEGSSNYRSSPSRTIHTGPRGGKYYINKNGKKTYVKKKN